MDEPPAAIPHGTDGAAVGVGMAGIGGSARLTKLSLITTGVSEPELSRLDRWREARRLGAPDWKCWSPDDSDAADSAGDGGAEPIRRTSDEERGSERADDGGLGPAALAPPWSIHCV